MTITNSNTDTKTAVKEATLNELQDGPRPIQTLTNLVNIQYRKEAVLSGNEEEKVHASEVAEVLEEMAADGLVEPINDPEGWYQLTDWDDRPLRVLSVSHHQIKIDGVGQIESLWLDESIRAARFEHDIPDPELQSIKDEDDRCCYLICTCNFTVLNQYRETLRRLADETSGGGTDQPMVYARLAEATDIEDKNDRKKREIPLRD